MKLFYRLASAALAVIFLAACSQKEDLNLTQAEIDAMNEEEEEATEEEASDVDYESVIFDASFEDNSFSKTSSTETEYGTYRIEWKESDAITVFSSSNEGGVKFVVKEVDKDNPTKATFIKDPAETGLLGKGPYWAAYPYGAATYYQQKMFFTQATSQVYAEGSIPDGANNAAAYTEDTSLKFKNVCGVVKFTLTASEATQIKSINLADPYAGLGGYATVIMGSEGSLESVSNFREAGSSIDLDCEGVSLGADSKVFNIICPVGAFDKALKLTVENTEGKVFIKTSTSAEGGNTVVRSKVLQMPTLNCSSFTDKPQKEEITFEASSETVQDEDTKTGTSDSGSSISVKWTSGDKIRIFSPDCTNGEVYELVSGAGEGSAKFKGGSIPGKGPFWAVYPESGWSFTYSDGVGTLEYTNNATLAVATGTVPNGSLPMVAYSGSSTLSKVSFNFKNLFAIIKIPATCSVDATLGRNTLKQFQLEDANSNGLYGTTTVTMNASGGISTARLTESKGSTLTMASTATLSSDATNYYIPVPPGAFATANSLRARFVTSHTVGEKVYDFPITSNNTSGYSLGPNADKVLAFPTVNVSRWVTHTKTASLGQVEMNETNDNRTIFHNEDTYAITGTRVSGTLVSEVLYQLKNSSGDVVGSITNSSVSGCNVTVGETSACPAGIYNLISTSDVALENKNAPIRCTLQVYVGPKNTTTGDIGYGTCCTVKSGIENSVNYGNYYGGALKAVLKSEYTSATTKATIDDANTKFYIYNGTDPSSSTKTEYANTYGHIYNDNNVADVAGGGIIKITASGNTFQEPIGTFTEKAFYDEVTYSGADFGRTFPAFSPDGDVVYMISDNVSGTECYLYAYRISTKTTIWTKKLGHSMAYNNNITVNPVTGIIYVGYNSGSAKTGSGYYTDDPSYYKLLSVNPSGATKSTMTNSTCACAPFRGAIAVNSQGTHIFVGTVTGSFISFKDDGTGVLTEQVAWLQRCLLKGLITLDTHDEWEHIYYSAFNDYTSTQVHVGYIHYHLTDNNYSFYDGSTTATSGTHGAESPAGIFGHVAYDFGTSSLKYDIHLYNGVIDSGPYLNWDFFQYDRQGNNDTEFNHHKTKALSSGTATPFGGCDCHGRLWIASQLSSNYYGRMSVWTNPDIESYSEVSNDYNTGSAYCYGCPAFTSNGRGYMPIGHTGKIITFTTNSSGVNDTTTFATSTKRVFYNGINIAGKYIVATGAAGMAIRITKDGATRLPTQKSSPTYSDYVGKIFWQSFRGDQCGTNNLNTIYGFCLEPNSSSNYMYNYHVSDVPR